MPYTPKRGYMSYQFNPLQLNPALWLKADAGLVTDGAASFASASSQYLSCASNSTLQTGDVDFWVAGWVKLTDKAAIRMLVTKDGATEEYMLYYSSASDRFRFDVFRPTNSTVAAVADSFGSPTAGQWVFLFGYHDSVNDTVNISVNGGAVNSTATGGALQAAGAAEFDIGRRQSVSNFPLNGQLDSVAFGKSLPGGFAMTPAATIAAALYNSGSGVCSSDITSAQKTAWGGVSWWDFAQPGSGLLVDSWGSNTLTNNNTVTFAAGVVSGTAGNNDSVTTWQDQSGNGNNVTLADNTGIWDDPTTALAAMGLKVITSTP